jgi:hypothetical protein
MISNNLVTLGKGMGDFPHAFVRGEKGAHLFTRGRGCCARPVATTRVTGPSHKDIYYGSRGLKAESQSPQGTRVLLYY